MSTTPPPPPPGTPPPPPQHWAAHPSGIPSDARNWAMAAHLSALAAGMFLGLSFLGPLIVWLVKRDGQPFVDAHGKEALNFNLSALLYVVLGVVATVVVAIVTLGLGLLVLVPLGIAAGIGWLVVTIVAAVRAANGEHYRYPLTIRFVS